MPPVLTPPPTPGTPIAPQGSTQSPQGVGGQLPVAAPTPPRLPQAQAPISAPPPNAVQAPNLNMAQQLQTIGDVYSIPRQTQALVGTGQAQGAQAQSQFEAQKYQNTLSIEHEKDALDPSSYHFEKQPDGSVVILNSLGDKVSIGTYAALTGENPAQALQQAGATDKADAQFIAAYNNMQSYVQAKIAAQNGDSQAQAEVNDFNKANPGLANIELGQLNAAFMAQYGSYFGEPQQGAGGGNLAPGIGPTLTSENNPASTSAYENPTYTQLLGTGSPYQPSPAAEGASAVNGGSSASSMLAELQAQEQAASGQ